MTLSTVNDRGYPSSRIVLLKDIKKDGLSFFTNYNSRKGQDLVQNPAASVLFLAGTATAGSGGSDRRKAICGRI